MNRTTYKKYYPHFTNIPAVNQYSNDIKQYPLDYIENSVYYHPSGRNYEANGQIRRDVPLSQYPGTNGIIPGSAPRMRQCLFKEGVYNSNPVCAKYAKNVFNGQIMVDRSGAPPSSAYLRLSSM